jgi:hypothetical protein
MLGAVFGEIAMICKTFASVLLLALLSAAARAETPGWCQYSLADLPKGAPRFEDYAAPVEKIARTPRVDFHGDGTARLFRTQLRDAAKGGVNFAGHYALGQWGCGTGCLNWGVVDLESGRTATDKTMFSLENNRIDFSRDHAAEGIAKRLHAQYVFGVLLFRADSRLLVTLGQPNEDETRDGAAFYEWSGAAFRRIAFYPAMTLCKKPD